MSVIEKLVKKSLIKPPSFVAGSTQYEVIMGSQAYAVSEDKSDLDVYGFCIPAKEDIFPHLKGEIVGFGKQIQRFEQFQQHHVKDNDSGKEYDLTIYNIVKFFQLCMENNPNMIDSLFVPENCILKATPLARNIRDHRKMFLHKGAWHKFKGYAYAQMHKMRIKNPDKDSTRYESHQKHGYDLKFAYHVVRLLGEIEQILIEQDLDITKNNEQLKSIRRGEWTIEQIEQHFFDKEKSLETAYINSPLQHGPNQGAIKKLLLDSLETYYGSLENCIDSLDKNTEILKQIKQLVSGV